MNTNGDLAWVLGGNLQRDRAEINVMNNFGTMGEDNCIDNASQSRVGVITVPTVSRKRDLDIWDVGTVRI